LGSGVKGEGNKGGRRKKLVILKKIALPLSIEMQKKERNKSYI